MIAVIFLRHGDAERGQRALPRAERLISQLGRTIPAGESAGDIDAVNETDASDDADRLRAQCESHFRDGRSEDAIGILDRLMTHYAQTKQTPKILRTLETLAEQFPREPGLRSRLARTYEQLGRVPDAIAQWDALAVVLIEIGQYEEAIQVIRLIIHLPSSDNPRN
jgi:tetratricopeptide (TPR) repeat protein